MKKIAQNLFCRCMQEELYLLLFFLQCSSCRVLKKIFFLGEFVLVFFWEGREFLWITDAWFYAIFACLLRFDFFMQFLICFTKLSYILYPFCHPLLSSFIKLTFKLFIIIEMYPWLFNSLVQCCPNWEPRSPNFFENVTNRTI